MGEKYIQDNFVEEILLHEATHTSLDEQWNPNSPIKIQEWLEVINKDNIYPTPYAKQFPKREDLAETFPIYYAIKFKRKQLININDNEIKLIENSLKHRFEYLDRKIKKYLN